MKKVKVWIEEHLCREIEIEVPDEMSVDERMEFAETTAKYMYKNSVIVLDEDDFNGVVIMSARDIETNNRTEWHKI